MKNNNTRKLLGQQTPEECIHDYRQPDIGECPTLGDGMPPGFVILPIMNCPRCNDYNKCRRKCRLKKQELAKHEKYIAREERIKNK